MGGAGWRSLAARVRPWHAAALAVAITLPSVVAGYAADDWTQQLVLSGDSAFGGGWTWLRLFGLGRGDPTTILALRDRGGLPWFTDEGLRLAVLRPLAGATHALDQWVAPGSPAIAHLQSIAWYGFAAAAAAA
ncbi:MAG: hypothetical protein ABMB14_41155, partial [Myxococcota bacterium]